MKIGITMFCTDEAMNPAELAREAEQRGFESFYIPEHTHIPSCRRTPAPTGDPELPREYRRTLDPFVTLAAAATVTSRIKIGTGICLVAQRDPIVTAKEVASLDLLSGGRFIFGIGFGWNREEIASHGTDFRRRREIARERILAMQKLWSEDEAAFAGEFVNFEASWAWPKPVQKPWPRILIGGAAGPKMFAHIAEYADGWIPIGGGGISKVLPDLRRAMEEKGRDPATLEIIPFGTVPDPGKFEYYQSLGISEVVLRIPSAPKDVVMPKLDEYAELL